MYDLLQARPNMLQACPVMFSRVDSCWSTIVSSRAMVVSCSVMVAAWFNTWFNKRSILFSSRVMVVAWSSKCHISESGTSSDRSMSRQTSSRVEDIGWNVVPHHFDLVSGLINTIYKNYNQFYFLITGRQIKKCPIVEQI